MSVTDVMTPSGQKNGEARFAGREVRFARKNTRRNMALLAVVQAARRMWPVKTAHWLAGFSGVTVRAAQLTLAETTEPSGATLATLIRSEAGLEFLRELMSPDFGPQPGWWKDTALGLRLVELERRAAENRAAMDEARRRIGEAPNE